MSERKEPWEIHSDVWKTKAAFFAYIRGGIRSIWSTYPPKLIWKKAQMSPPPKGYTGRAKTLGVCHYCNEQFAASHLEVDHVEQAGTCNSWDTAAEFLHNLLDCNGNWVLACKPCHKIKSYAERQGVSFQAAMIEKQVIETLKDKKKTLDLCTKMGYNTSELTNEAKRRAALQEIFSKGET